MTINLLHHLSYVISDHKSRDESSPLVGKWLHSRSVESATIGHAENCQIFKESFVSMSVLQMIMYHHDRISHIFYDRCITIDKSTYSIKVIFYEEWRMKNSTVLIQFKYGMMEKKIKTVVNLYDENEIYIKSMINK